MNDFEPKILERLTKIETLFLEQTKAANARLKKIEDILIDDGRDGLIQRIQKIEDEKMNNKETKESGIAWVALAISVVNVVLAWLSGNK